MNKSGSDISRCYLSLTVQSSKSVDSPTLSIDLKVIAVVISRSSISCHRSTPSTSSVALALTQGAPWLPF
ncbi:hypothetical protein DY000_02022880 [Brassica cretica]|uniref:Uncharacterized protein n=1 Tax=Brassica cretica TaxID=69181 RepID=A0ABQ7E1Q4_BRACR|nr:hypothetical protein DY000_02022880 [Brassica cretica]